MAGPAGARRPWTERARNLAASLAQTTLAPSTPLWIAQATLQAVYRTPLPSKALDLAGLELAKALGELVINAPERARRLIAHLQRRGACPIAVAGDSHSTLYVRRGVRSRRWLLPVHLFCTGASARGLGSPHSRSGHGERVRAFVASLEPATPILFKFGQVDVEFVSIFKRLETGRTAYDPAAFDAFCKETVARYFSFLGHAVPAERRWQTFVASIFPPALSDLAWAQGYVNAHIAELHGHANQSRLAAEVSRLEVPSLAERTAMHVRFNGLLQDAAQRSGSSFLDDFNPLLGPDQTVDAGYLSRGGGADHHLGFVVTRAPLLELLWRAVDGP